MSIPPEILWGLAAFFGAKAVEWIIGVLQKKGDKGEDALEKLDAQVFELTDVTRELRYEVRSLREKVAMIPKLSDDITKAHIAIKEIRVQLPKNQ